MSDWKESANNRRDFRQSKDPIIPLHTKKRSGKKLYKVEYRNPTGIFMTDWTLFGRYKTEKDAQQAISTIENRWGKKFGYESRLIDETKKEIE